MARRPHPSLRPSIRPDTTGDARLYDGRGDLLWRPRSRERPVLGRRYRYLEGLHLLLPDVRDHDHQSVAHLQLISGAAPAGTSGPRSPALNVTTRFRV